ncbi:hypothetical protein [Algoriphagus hitonicola]|uniref:Uncharacterized protein n=1 Tax=Algoriphagus hitonicola TaxID=435880 RepID=A0A1I2XDE2_9BACT|nr:hypothetical protein [Algoriphagus hitonicola]SFH11513.1 hypothetical protein SAMN04487988_11814 [Algoriphagus hitonicola]
MIIQTNTGTFLIENCLNKNDRIAIKSDSEVEILRFFGSTPVFKTGDYNFPYQVSVCKQVFSDALILMVKEIDYTDFHNNSDLIQ